jgi:hypothetical protein
LDFANTFLNLEEILQVRDRLVALPWRRLGVLDGVWSILLKALA